MQFGQSLPPRCFGLDLIGFRQRSEQRVRLLKLGHLRRRRKAIECGREDGVGVGRACGRLIELRERKRCAQFEAARLLHSSDFDGAFEGFLGGSGVRGVALDQQLAVRPVQLGLEGAISHAIVCRQRFIKNCDGPARIARASLGLGQRNLEQSIKHQNVLFARKIGTATHVLEFGDERAAPPLSPSLQKYSASPKHRQIMLVREVDEHEGVRRGARRVATHHFEHGPMHFPVREHPDVGEIRHPRLHVLNERTSVIDLAERP